MKQGFRKTRWYCVPNLRFDASVGAYEAVASRKSGQARQLLQTEGTTTIWMKVGFASIGGDATPKWLIGIVGRASLESVFVHAAIRGVTSERVENVTNSHQRLQPWADAMSWFWIFG